MEKNYITLKTLVEEGRVEYTASTSGGEYAGQCPFCKKEEEWTGDDRFRVWPEHPEDETGRFWCRQCQEKGDGIDFLMKMEGLEYVEAKRYLKARK